MSDALVFGSFPAVMIVALLLTVSAVFLLGLVFIPLLRAKKTGRLEWKIGKRSRADGSEPSMGGLVMALGFAAWLFPTAAVAELNGSSTLNSRGALIFAGIYVIIIMCVGALEDRLTKFRASPAGLPAGLKQLVIFSASLGLLLAFEIWGSVDTDVLLPFRLGFAELGMFYYPITAMFMTFTVDVFRLHFCFGSDYTTAVGGLTEFTGAVSLMTVGICCERVGASGAGYLAEFGAAACIGLLIYTASPSKLWSGASGSMFIGALLAASAVMSKMELLLVTAALPQLADALTAALHFIRFKRAPAPRPAELSPRRSLRMLWRERGFRDYTVMLLFGLIGLIGGVLSVIFAVYAESLFLRM